MNPKEGHNLNFMQRQKALFFRAPQEKTYLNVGVE